MIKHHLGPQLRVWIMQVSLFSSVLINRFHYITILPMFQKKDCINTLPSCYSHYYIIILNYFLAMVVSPNVHDLHW